MTDKKLRTMAIFADTVKRGGPCRGPNCDVQQLWWAEAANTGKTHPFSDEPVALRSEDRAGRQVWFVDMAQSHFSSCVDAPRFR